MGEDHGFVNQAFNDNTPITAWSTVASWVYTPNSNVVNELRFGYNRVSFDFVNVDIGNFANGTGVYNFINTGAPTGGFPNVNISGLAPLGTNSNRPQFNDGNPYYDIQDSISILRGKHTIKFGGEFSHSEADAAILVGGRGIFNLGFFTFVTPRGLLRRDPDERNPSHRQRVRPYYVEDRIRVSPGRLACYPEVDH